MRAVSNQEWVIMARVWYLFQNWLELSLSSFLNLYVWAAWATIPYVRGQKSYANSMLKTKFWIEIKCWTSQILLVRLELECHERFKVDNSLQVTYSIPIHTVNLIHNPVSFIYLKSIFRWRKKPGKTKFIRIDYVLYYTTLQGGGIWDLISR